MFSPALAFAAILVASPAPTAAPVSKEIQEAADNLDHDEYRVRANAARKLLDAGKEAIAPLVRVTKSGSVDAADRAVKILAELAFKSKPETMTAGREALRAVAASTSSAAGQAKSALDRFRSELVDKMQTAGAGFQYQGDAIRAIYLDRVKDLSTVLPLLQEFPEIEELSLSNKGFDDAGMKHLLPLKKLKWLNLFESNIGDEAMKSMKLFPVLDGIPMGHTRVTDAGLEHLKDMKQLVYIGVRGDNITDAGLAHLKNLTNLTDIFLGETKITDAGLVHLQGMKKLSFLRLHKTAISDKGLEKLYPIKSLRQITLWDTNATDSGLRKLEKEIPEISVLQD